ncbi:energy-coupling factor ABC transporter ATP-binding protein [Peribacillus sp. SCS-155]|uniref:energy-coupling factor ABC transporter ATP-binding protein n=1 Tax=Peribacillus sedimenti TaxID=3115297 RepID=UPI003905E24B
MINIKNLAFSYGEGASALSGITLDFDERTTAIIGQNGAGKTTFVKLLKGLLKPYSGQILINGKDVKNHTAAQLSKEIGLVFQNPNHQIFKSKVLDEVLFGPRTIKMNEATAKMKALEAIELVGLSDRLDENPQDLSLSEKKLLCIAAVLAMDTSIVIFDEPTIAQDYSGKQKIRRIIQELKQRNKLVLTIIHDMDFAAENFERIIVFNEGKAILDGTAREVFSQSVILEKAYVEAPSITKLGEELGYSETFLTVEEFIRRKEQKR